MVPSLVFAGASLLLKSIQVSDSRPVFTESSLTVISGLRLHGQLDDAHLQCGFHAIVAIIGAEYINSDPVPRS